MTEDALKFCREYTQAHYENFTVASWLLPKEIRQSFYPIYSFCRWADDLGDESPDNATALRRLDDWESQLNRCYGGEAEHPIFIALKPVIDQYAIPQSLFSDLINAFRRDQIQKKYTTRQELLDYCRQSANPVGRIVLQLAKTTDNESLALSDKICTALQLTNHWQDVSRDKNRRNADGVSDSRRYIPLEDMTRFSYTESDFENETYNVNFVNLMSDLCAWAEDLFNQGAPLVKRVPRSFKTDIKLFTLGGKQIVGAIRNVKYNVWSNRPTISHWCKLKLMIQALWR